MSKVLTEHEREVLGALASSLTHRPDTWLRPMDVGGTDASHHSATLARLCRKGLVERARRNTLANVYRPGLRGSWCYRITDAGRTLVEHIAPNPEDT